MSFLDVTSQRSLLIVGGSHSDIPLIKSGKELGFRVTTTGNKPSDLGHKFSDCYVDVDFSSPEQVLSLARDLNIDAICASCNDFAALSAAYVAQELNLPGHDSVEISQIIHLKDSWRCYASRHSIPSPRARSISNLSDLPEALKHLVFPILVKPIDLTGGKGIETVFSEQEAFTAVSNALQLSKANRCVIEEHVTGTKHGFSAFLVNQTVIFWFADNEHYHLSPYLVSGASTPSSCASSSIQKLIAYSNSIAKDLKLVDGIFHVQFIERHPGDPVIIEICRRAPGDLYIELVRHAAGVPYSSWIVGASAGLPFGSATNISQSRFLTRHCLMANETGIFSGFRCLPTEGMRLIDGIVWGRPGVHISEPQRQKLGIIFLEYQTLSIMKRYAPILQDILVCEVVQ